MLVECLVVFVFAFVFGVALWALFGLLLMPVFEEDMVTFFFARGSGEGLEQRVRGYGWLRDGKKHGGRLVIVDCGLTEQGLLTVQHLCRRYDWLDYCPHEIMDDHLDVLHHWLENRIRS